MCDESDHTKVGGFVKKNILYIPTEKFQSGIVLKSTTQNEYKSLTPQCGGSFPYIGFNNEPVYDLNIKYDTDLQSKKSIGIASTTLRHGSTGILIRCRTQYYLLEKHWN